MVPPQDPPIFSAEPQMLKEMSAGDEASSTKALWNKRCAEFDDYLRKFPWFEEYQNLMKEFISKEIDRPTTVEKVVQLFQGHPELIVGFNQILSGKHQKRKRRDDDNDGGTVDARPKDSKIRRVIPCEKKTKERFRHEDMESDDGRRVFLEHKAPTLSPIPRINTVPKNKSESDGDSTTDRDEAEPTDIRIEKVIAFVNKVCERFGNKGEVVAMFFHMICKRNRSSPNRFIKPDEEEFMLYKKVATVLDGEQDLIDDLTQFLTRVPRMNEMVDFHKLEKITPSYRQLPKNFPIPAATGRSEIASEVLNDSLICVDTGAGTRTSSTSRGGGEPYKKLQDELDLIDWEDDMYEHEMSECYVFIASENIKEVYRKIENQQPTKKICIENRLRPRTLRCIEGLYGDRGLEKIDALKNNPRQHLPEILESLEKKVTELRDRGLEKIEALKNNPRQHLPEILESLEKRGTELRDRSDLRTKWAHIYHNQ